MNAIDPRFVAASRAGVQGLPLSHAQLRQFDTIIDARTPAEFTLDHIPGAINCPVLDNEQRGVVGTAQRWWHVILPRLSNNNSRISPEAGSR
jgi:hypothetical protein